MWITIEQIQCLQAVKEHGSFNAAAEHLHKAKSAIAYSISKLEEQIGFATLDRSSYRTKLTPQGEAFLIKAKILLKNLDQLKEEVHKISTGIEMKICISASAIYPTRRLNSILKSLITKFDSTEFTFHREILSGEKMLMSDTVDIAIFENLQNTMDIEAKKIDSIDLKLVISSTHPFLQLPKNQQTIEKLKNYPQIIQRSTVPDSSTMGILEDSKQWTVSDIDSKKDLIMNDLGWGRLPDHFVEKELQKNTLTHLHWLKYDHRVKVFICKKKNKPFGPVLRSIWDSF